MKILLTLILSIHSLAYASLSADWVDENATGQQSSSVKTAFKSIIDAQATALEQIDEESSHNKSLPYGFKMTEMVTDLAVSKSGILGLAALKSNNGIELKWKKVSKPALILEEEDSADIVIDSDISEKDLENLSSTIFKIAESSGKIKTTSFLKSYLHSSLKSVHEQIKDIQVTQNGRWKATSLRCDLNLGANGEVWFFTRAGVAIRVRMEWKLKERSLKLAQSELKPQSKFVVKVLDALNKSFATVTIKGFEPNKISIGVGSSYKRGLFGLWKATAGFMGFISFTQVKNKNGKSIEAYQVSKSILDEGFTIGSEELVTATTNKSFRRPTPISHERFVAGMKKSLETAAFFAESSLEQTYKKWMISEIKTVNDISYKGFFGISDFTAKGVVEIDFKRINL